MEEETCRIDLILYPFIFSILKKENHIYVIRKRKKAIAFSGESNKSKCDDRTGRIVNKC
jgi:hypothetical protein